MFKLFGHLFAAPFKLIGGLYKAPKKISKSMWGGLGNMLLIRDIEKFLRGKK